MSPHNTIKSLEGIVEFGYDHDKQLYIELCCNCTVVMTYDNDDNLQTKLYRNGVEIRKQELSKDQLYQVDNLLEEFKGECGNS
jgi:hypothetical protein